MNHNNATTELRTRSAEACGSGGSPKPTFARFGEPLNFRLFDSIDPKRPPSLTPLYRPGLLRSFFRQSRLAQRRNDQFARNRVQAGDFEQAKSEIRL